MNNAYKNILKIIFWSNPTILTDRFDLNQNSPIKYFERDINMILTSEWSQVPHGLKYEKNGYMRKNEETRKKNTKNILFDIFWFFGKNKNY